MTMKMSFCLKAATTLDDQDLASITDGIEAYVKAGMPVEQAEAAAIDDLLAQVGAERAEVVGLLRAQHADLFDPSSAGAKQEAGAEDLNAMFGELLAEETAATAPKAPRAPLAPGATPRTPRAPRTATQAAASAATNTASALGNAIDGLGALFGGNGTLGSGPVFNEETYAKAKPLFVAAVSNLKDAAADLREAMRTVLRMVLDKFGADTAKNMQPYIVRFIGDVRDGKVVIGASSADTEAKGAQDAEPIRPGPDQLGQGQEPGVGGGMADGGSGGARPDGTLAPQPAADGGTAGAPGDLAGTGTRAGEPAGPDGAGVPGLGDGADGRSGAGGSGLATAGPGSAGQSRAGPARSNYHVADPEQLIGGTPKVRFARNRAAIEAYNSIVSEGRAPSEQDLDAMAAYIGWGSFGQELFQGNWDNPRPKPAWEKEDTWLREHMGRAAWESAQGSIINAHYTDPITVGVMWDMVRALGFKGGRVLEPSMGIGNFYGLMPLDLMAQSTLTGIELDTLTGGMAQLLYPEANVQIKGYEQSHTADGFYDLVIGNWPFDKDGPVDRRYARLNPSLHDYFLLKALNQTRAGGLVVGITSAGTMDKRGKATRMELAKLGELVAAYRLPSGAFEKYAGTSVVTDIIVLRKREAPLADVSKEPWIEVGEFTPDNGGDPFAVNQYLLDHPDHILGKLSFGSGSTYGRPSMIVERPADLLERLQALPGKMPADTFTPRTEQVQKVRFVSNNTKDRQGSITQHEDGALYVVQGDQLAALEDVVKYRVKDPKETAAREDELRRLIGIRRAYGKLIDAERAGADDIEALRADMRKQYEDFTKKTKRTINDSRGLAIMERARDPFFAVLAALEHKGKPAMIFTRSTVRSPKKMDKPTVRDAFVEARNSDLSIDMAKIAEAAGVPQAQAVAELEASGAIFKTPDGTYEVKDVYLSGNVRRKLREAQEALTTDPTMQRNVDALNKVMPRTVPYFQIEAKLGAPWVKHDHYKQFVAELLSVAGKAGENHITVSFVAGSWKVRFEGDNDALNRRPEATTQWGMPRSAIRFDKLITAAMNNRAVTIKYKDSDGNMVVSEDDTKQANEKITRLREEFSQWAWRDAERRVWLEDNYNQVMNAIATPAFDGSFLEFPGMALQRGNDPFSLRAHQVNAIWRGLANGAGLFAHEVGTGKTYTMAGIAVESRRYGLAKKPLLFAHNANSATVAREINDMYPGASVLYVDNLEPSQIDMTMRKIANDDWDVVVVPHSLIDRFSLTEDTLKAITAEEIAALEQEALDAASEEGVPLSVKDMDDPDAMKKVRSATAKQLVHARNQIKKKIATMVMRSSKEGAIPFEELGVDMVIVDEAHEFKKPPITTKMKLRGLNTATSNKSIALRFLTDYVKSQNNGRGVHTFTGTPITNTLAEIYNQMRYVMDGQMERDGIKDWDTWFASFADSISDVEVTTSGEYEAVTRLASFVNVAELRRMAGQYMDIVFADDMPEFKPRPTKSGKIASDPTLTDEERAELLVSRSENPVGRPYKKIISDTAPMTPAQAVMRDRIVELTNEFKRASKKQRREIMLSGHPASPVLTETMASNAGLDARLVDMSAADYPDSKANRVVRNVKRHYDEHPLATQVIFVDRGYSDIGTKTKTDAQGNKHVTKFAKFNLAKELVEKLEAQGIPREQIAIVDGSMSKEARKAVADAMNEAKVRVVIGLTSTLGVGVNMQTNLRAMHHMDAPWMPGELEQRNGRGWRQGNKWDTVLEYRYITEVLDGRRWQVLAVKARFIKDFLTADENTRIIDGDAVDMDEGEGGSDISQTLSEAAGDPRIMIREKLKGDITRLETRERMHTFGVADAKGKARDLRESRKHEAAQLEELTEDVDRYAKARENPKFTATIGGKAITKRADFDEALSEHADDEIDAGDTEKPLGTVHGFKLVGLWPKWSSGIMVRVKGAGTYDVSPTIQSIEGVLRNLAKKASDLEATMAERLESAKRLDEVAKQQFQQAPVLEKKKTMLAELEYDLQRNPTAPPTWLRAGTPVNTVMYVDGDPVVVEGHTWNERGYFILTAEGDVPYMEANDESGFPIYTEHPFTPPVTSLSGMKLTDQMGRSVEVVRGPYTEKDGPPLVEVKRTNSDGKTIKEQILASTLIMPMPRKQNLRKRKSRADARDLEAEAWDIANPTGYPNVPNVNFSLQQATDFEDFRTRLPEVFPAGPVLDQDAAAVAKVETAFRKALPALKLTALPRLKPNERDSTLVQERHAAVQLTERLFGKRVIWFGSNVPFANGLHADYVPDAIFISESTTRPLMAVLGHELLHTMRRDHLGLYRGLGDRLSGMLVEPGSYGQLLNARRRARGLPELGFDKLREELIADIVGDNFTDPIFWRRMQQGQPGLFQRVLSVIRDFLDKLLSKLKNERPYGTAKYLDDIAGARDAVAEAMRAFAESPKSTADAASLGSMSLSQNTDPFYSELARQVEVTPMGGGNAAAWKNFFKGLTNKGGVKADEIAWTGIEDWLDLQPGKVTRAEVLDYLNANGVRVTETVLRNAENRVLEPDEIEDDLRNEYRNKDTAWLYGRYEAVLDERAPEDMSRTEMIDAIVEVELSYFRSNPEEYTESEQRGGSTKYMQYTLPGGTNYREVLLTLPAKSSGKYWALEDTIVPGHPRWMVASRRESDGETVYNGKSHGSKAAAEQAIQEIEGKNNYKSGHWDAPNVLAHIRVNDRTDSEGRRVLFVEELQSDWQAATRKAQTAIAQAVDTDFEGIVKRMKAAGVLEVNCD